MAIALALTKRLRAGQINKLAAAMEAAAPATKKKKGLHPALEQRLKKAARVRVPSEPWVEAQFPEHFAPNEDGDLARVVTYAPELFPPGGGRTLMVECKKCGRLHPPEPRCLLVTDKDGKTHREPIPQCIDHLPRKYHSAYGESPSARAIRGAAERNLRLEESYLPSEKKSALRQEIKRFLSKRK